MKSMKHAGDRRSAALWDAPDASTPCLACFYFELLHEFNFHIFLTPLQAGGGWK